MLLLRVGAGGLMVPHGWGKLERLRTGLAEGEVRFYDWMGLGEELSLGLAVFGELVAPAFIVLGLFTRWMSVPAAPFVPCCARKSSFRMSIWLWTRASLMAPLPLGCMKMWTTTGTR